MDLQGDGGCFGEDGSEAGGGGDGRYTGGDGRGGVDDGGGDGGCAGDEGEEGSGEVFGGGAVVGRADGSCCSADEFDGSKEDEESEQGDASGEHVVCLRLAMSRLRNYQKFWNARKQIETLYTCQRPIIIKAEIFVPHTITISSS